MTTYQQEGLLALLRAVAENELEVEDARRRLSEAPDFYPKVLFQVLRGGSYPSKGWVSSYDLYLWLSQQPHHVARHPSEEVAAAVTLKIGARELWFEDFVKLALPNFSSGAWLKELALARSQGSYFPKETSVSASVAFLFSQLMRSELELCLHLRFHRQRLRDLGVSLDAAIRWLDAQQGVVAGMGGLLSSASVRHSLSMGLGGNSILAFSQAQCDAILNRINPTGATLFSGDALGRLLDLPLLSGFSSMSSPRRYETPARSLSPARFFDSPARAFDSIAPRDSPIKSILDRSSTYATPVKESWGSLSPGSPTTPMPDYLQPDSRPPRHNGQKYMSAPIAGSVSGFTSPRGRLDSAYTPRGKSSSPPRSVELPYGKDSRLSTMSTYASPNSRSPSRAWSPASRSLTLSPAMPLETYSSTQFHSPLLSSPRTQFHSPLLSSPRGNGEWRAMRQTLRVMLRQAQLDARLEDAKLLLPLTCSIPEDVFAELDVLRINQINLNDVRRLLGSYGTTVTYSGFGALVHELQLKRQGYEQKRFGGDHLQFQDICTLVLPLSSEAYKQVSHVSTDHESKAVLRLLRNSEPCPVVEPGLTLTAASRYQVYRLLCTAMQAAEEAENDRRDLSLMLAQELCGLCDVFAAIAGTRDRLGFTESDLRRAFALQGLPQPHGAEMDLIWNRYSTQHSPRVNFLDFKAQLQSRL